MMHPSPEEHCIHECVCGDYKNGSGWGYDELGKYGWQDHSICKIPNCDNDIRVRPDPVEVLEKYCIKMISEVDASRRAQYRDILNKIEELRTNPDAVKARGEKEGWYP